MNNFKPYTIETTLLVLSFLILAFVFFHYVWPAMNEVPLDDNLKARKPTRKEIEERNFLLMSDEMEEQLEAIKLDEHEKALA